MIRLVHAALAAAIVLLCGAVPLAAQGMAGQGVDMPNPKEMSGMPLPSGDLAPGTLTVRLVRGALTNPVPGQKVEISGAGAAPLTTNDAGRVEFTGLRPGTRVKVAATVEGERLESQEIVVPATGGIRVMLVATDPEMAKRQEEDRKLAQGPARKGIVVLGNQSRLVFEIGDDGLTVFNIFEIQNTARTPVEPAVPIVFDLPEEAKGASLLDGSSPLAAVAGRRVTVNGPFPPGPTLVQFAYTYPYTGGAATITQRLPAALAQLTIVAQKVGADMTVSSPQIAQQRDMQAEGQHYIVGHGAPLAAGSDVTVAFSGLPHVASWPRTLAITLAVLILVAGGIAAFRGAASGADAERARLERERERLFGRLTALEASNRAGTVDGQAYTEQRRQLIVALERVYAALDEQVAA